MSASLAQPIEHPDSKDKKELLAAIYARTSSPNQRFGYSLEEQIELCRERCKLIGWTVRYVYKEDGLSGKDIDRPKFMKMLEKAKEGAFDVIVFWKLDRFCRSLVDLVNTEKTLREQGVGLQSVTEQIDTTTSVGRFNFRNLASAAELEREFIGERARMGLHALAKKHAWPNPRPPVGYDKGADGCLIVNEEEADLVKRIFKMYLELRSMPQVAFVLNSEGLVTKLGNKWTQASVRKILDNRLYVGEYRVAGVEDYIGEYRVLDDDLFQEVDKIREGTKRKGKIPQDRKSLTIDKVFKEYLDFLDGETKTEII